MDNTLTPLPNLELSQQLSRRIFVTGATGFIGKHTCRSLADAGYDVVGLTRRVPAEGSESAVPGVTYVAGDVTDAQTLTPEKLAGCDAVVHLVGIITEIPSRGQTFEAVHAQGTRNLLAAARQAGVSGRFVYVSAIGSEPDAPSEYSRTKAQAEQAVRESGIPFTILRPSVVLGPDGEFLEQMEALIRRPPLSPFSLPFVPVPGSGRNQFQPVAVADLAEAIARCLSEPAAANQTYDIGGATVVTFNELIQAIQERIGIRKPLLHIPLPLMFPVAAALEALLPRPPVTTDQLLNLRCDSIADNEPLRAALNLNPLPFNEVLSRAFAGRENVSAVD